MGQTMRAAMYRGPAEIEIVDVERPTASEDTAVIEVSHCGICGTDLHMVLDGWGRPDSIGGHEWSGTVIEAGRSDLVGTIVVGGPSAKCGTCRHCLAGRSSQCHGRSTPGVTAFQGAFAQMIATPITDLIPVPDGLDPGVAAFAEPLAVALHAVTLGRVGASDRVTVFGAGPIGAAIVAVLVHRGHEVRVVEPAPLRAELAATLGAAVVATADLGAPPMPMEVVDEPADVVFECSGKAVAMEAGLEQLERTGRLVLVGTGMEAPRFDPNRILLNELVITGAFNYDDDGFAVALDLLSDSRFPVEELIDPTTIGLDDLLVTMRRLGDGEIAGKVMVSPS